MPNSKSTIIEIENAMWGLFDSFRGKGELRDITHISYAAPMTAYVATLMSGQAERIPLAKTLRQHNVDAMVKSFLMDNFTEPLQETAWSLSREFGAKDLSNFVINFNIAEDTGRTSGDMATPECVTELALAILDIRPGEHIADLGCGCGNWLVEAAEHQRYAKYYGIDINTISACLAKIRMSLVGADAEIEVGDMLASNPDRKFDKVFSNYPFGVRLNLADGAGYYYDNLKTGETGFGRPISSDWIFNRMVFDSLSSGGKAVAVMTSGAAFNGGDRRARKYFLDNNMIQAIVALPANIFRYTGVATVLIVLGHNDGAIRLVDATDLSVPGRRWSTMGAREIDEVMRRLRQDGEHSCLIKKEALSVDEYNLYPPRLLGRDIVLENPTPLGQLATSIERGAGLTAKDLDEISTSEDTGISYLRLSDITDGRISGSLPHLRECDGKYESQCLKTGDLLISKNGSPFKIAVAEVPDGQTILANGNLYIVRLDESRVDPHFVAAFLTSEDGREVLGKLVVGTAIPSLPVKNLKNVQIPLPPLERQKPVAEDYQARLDEIEILKIKLDKARDKAACAYDEVMNR